MRRIEINDIVWPTDDESDVKVAKEEMRALLIDEIKTMDIDELVSDYRVNGMRHLEIEVNVLHQ